MSFKKIHTQDYAFHANPEDPRIVSRIVLDLDDADFVVMGYPDEEGIKLNGGRVGASLGPHEIRKAFYKMTSGLLPAHKLFDAGNIDTNLELSQRHVYARQKVEQVYALGKFPITLGGGHDYGYPDAQGFLNAYKDSKLKPVVINFDAHLDVRPTDNGLTSGTPFYRLLSENPKACHFFEVGIQPHCNSTTHRAWCEKQGGKIITMAEIQAKGMLSTLKKSLAKFKNHPTFISIDIDGFSSAFAPGCSQSWPTGFTPADFFKGFDYLFQTLSVKGLGIYEVSPPLDVQPLTSRLAALILYRCLEIIPGRGQNVQKSKRIRKR